MASERVDVPVPAVVVLDGDDETMTASDVSAVPEMVLHEAGKERAAFRDYSGDKGAQQLDNVRAHYRAMRSNQCVAFVQRMREKWLRFDKAEMTVWEAFEALEDFVDASDPDTTAPNLEHMLQTAEGLRRAGHPEWLQLTGLLHDLGKLMFKWGSPEDGQDARTEDGEQWALGGDTWVVGCPLPESMVFPEFNALNPDAGHEVYDNAALPCGMYEPHCGMSNLMYAWGHDEYMFQVLEHNCPDFPAMGKNIIRYHSCYPWHRGGAYTELMAPGDETVLEWVKVFNEHDLYTKADEEPDVEKLRPYYQGLIDRYCGAGKFKW